ncbi:DNA-3-methyladenine glycosylase 2 family protein [Streptomyces crystallinus]|uniref:DNA-3-methyladenine glycosylase family protein n=1 Tax=Streptomyces crystallinus TaxID=68191 RepID=UPI0031D6C098
MAGRFTPPNPTPTRATVRGGHIPLPTATPTPTAPREGTGEGTGEGTRHYTPPGPLDLALVLGPLRRGPADPTFRTTPDGSVWRASRTPDGPGTLRVAVRGGRAEAEAWGPGAEWLLDHLPGLLGDGDDPAGFAPRHRLVAESARRRPGLRLTRTGLVMESLIPSILEQKVTTDEAYRAWRLLVRKFGEPAPGPAPDRMYVMPDIRTWALIPSWEWHRAGVDAKRSSTVLRAVRVARRLEEAVTMDQEAAAARLHLVPGIGPWTSAETLQRAMGAPDLVSVGDYHLPGIVGYALAGDRTADDAAMLELLAPYAGQRHRATRLILLSGHTPPRRAPRMTPGNIAAL